MYRQILIYPRDRYYQRILWRNSTSEPYDHFWLTTVTYGTAAAPYLATRALKQLTIEFKNQFPLAEAALLNNFYVDDLLGGAEDVEEASQLYGQLTNLLKRRGFYLHHLHTETHCFNDQLDDGMKVLGLMWFPQEDCFTFNVNLHDSIKTTKRSILSESSRIFDPLGIISPVTISFKILLQQLWLRKYDWDDECTEFHQRWMLLRTNLHHLRKLRITRYVPVNTSSAQLHGFADASESAYAAVVYCRTIDENGSTAITLIASKSKVCPIKQLSIPRLELCAALLVTKLIQFISSNLNFPINHCYAWTDSTVVLASLSSHPRNWKCFIGNRTSEILSVIPRSRWNHVSSSSNPADLASRSVTAEHLLTSTLWWNGPKWLKYEWQNYAINSPRSSVEEVDIEKREKHIASFNITTSEHCLSLLFTKFSSLSKIINIMSKCFQFFRHCKSDEKDAANKTTWINGQDIRKAYFSCIKWAQNEEFARDIQDLRSGRQIQSSSRLLNLTPFLDQDGILRVGGRIDNSSASYDTKHPPILPKEHIFTRYLVRQLHEKYFHAGTSLLINIIRQHYWIISRRTIVKACVKHCVECARYRASVSEQLMANLPKHRVSVFKPFENIGVDYAGPFQLLLRRGRGAKTTKGYLVIFVCFCTRAIHLELAGDLTSDTFISCLKRFSSRRGLPSVIYSDNGTNFVGANRCLTEIDKFMKSLYKEHSLANFLYSNSITWKFNPHSCPHFGGLWEAGVKAVKSCLRKVIGEAKLTYEEMYTTLVQIEGLLNSRPLVPISDDHSSLDALTPAHFLIGQPLTMMPEVPQEHNRLILPERWRLVQNIYQNFWRRWHSEYLSSLQHRPKWLKVKPNLHIGDLVVVKESNIPPARWLLGRVIESHPGLDNITRVVTIKTAYGVFKRPSIKLCKLPVNDYQDGDKNQLVKTPLNGGSMLGKLADAYETKLQA